ncbi:MAG: hypothetical protein ACREM3_18010 [Candidatus Rokuibacteriota bacterium]
MVLRVILVAAVAVLAVAPQAHAFGGGGRGARSDAQISGNFSNGTDQSGTFSLSCSGPNCSGSTTSNGGNGPATVTTPEPLVALAAGLGLLGARYLRRRR